MLTIVTALGKSKLERSQLVLLICVSQAAWTRDEVRLCAALLATRSRV